MSYIQILEDTRTISNTPKTISHFEKIPHSNQQQVPTDLKLLQLHWAPGLRNCPRPDTHVILLVDGKAFWERYLQKNSANNANAQPHCGMSWPCKNEWHLSFRSQAGEWAWQVAEGGRNVIQQTLHVMIRIADHDISLHNLFAKKLANKTGWRFLGLQMFDVFPTCPVKRHSQSIPRPLQGQGPHGGALGGTLKTLKVESRLWHTVVYIAEKLYVLLDVILSYAAVLSVTIVFVVTCGYYMLTMVPTANMIAVVIP